MFIILSSLFNGWYNNEYELKNRKAKKIRMDQNVDQKVVLLPLSCVLFPSHATIPAK